jgi:hypothetical protein
MVGKNSTPSFMKFCPVVPEICHGQVHGARNERRITRYDYNLTIMKSQNFMKLGGAIDICF